ncbi:hypothetical protein PtA15_2A769 [Puccinia triticina]|uniref:Sugar phosphate transporter domain-containing protein n=1 Tax=Puccinia triticina TaxID=208348 RepID=A0ABY7CI33_9BASI|nr:uncharacterized protein PtA15_2A769 [Puccinia triticina]WAQ82452.1 hypothetical protein PtA15_2A769 [Puccinia triticina]
MPSRRAASDWDGTLSAILTRLRFPVTLTIVQFAFVALCSGLCLALRHHPLPAHRNHHGTTLLGHTLAIRIPNRATIRGTCIMSLFSIAGHVCSSMAISRVPVSTVHTIKALSPLFTVIAYAGLFGVRYGFNTYFSLLPLTLGVMLACSFDMRANGVGFLCALGSTVIFVSQNIFGKKLLPKESSSTTTPSGEKGHKRQSSVSGAAQMDKLNLLFYSSAIAFLMMIPIWLYTDLGALWTRSRTPADSSDGGIGLLGYFVFNGTVHFAQCILAFSILSRTSPVTYSIASLIKRVAVICIAIVWFGQPVSAVQALGMLLTFAGLFIYNRAKAEIDRGEARRGIIERRIDVLLPSTQHDLELLPEEAELKTSSQESHPPPPSSVQLSHSHSLQHLNSSSTGRATHPSSTTTTTTRQRAPSIPTPVSFIAPSDHPPPHPHHHSSPQQTQQHHHQSPEKQPLTQPFSSPHHQHHLPLTHPNPRPSLKAALQEPNPLLRPIVNVR